MGKQQIEAWITSAVDNGSVANAMVLADSLRQTGTSRKIVVIASRNLAKETCIALNHSFDLVLYLEDDVVINDPHDTHLILHAFSLNFFETCVFLSPNSLVLENADYLFDDGSTNFRVLKNRKGSIDFSIFKFQPNSEGIKNLLKNASFNKEVNSESLITNWLKTENNGPTMDFITDQTLAKLSLKERFLNTDKTHPSIVKFDDFGDNGTSILQEMESLQMMSVKGLREKIVAQKWLETYNQKVSNLLNNNNNTKTTISSLSSSQNRIWQNYINEPIAIIGMSCRYPGANNLEEFWNMLYNGKEGIREPPAFRWTKEHTLRVTPQDRTTKAGFLKVPVDEFDAKFFGISPKEAVTLDPQTRLLHEVLWESLENSGIDPHSLHGSHTGVFTGSWMNDYKDIVRGSGEHDVFRTYMSNGIGTAAAKLSLLLGLTGPSVATESGCSSSIVAVNLAVKSLRSGECNLAVATGVNLLLHPFSNTFMEHVISPDGRCKTFDSDANGFGRAEGCGVLVLKRLSDALRDRDNIWAMIRGSAVAQEGLSRSFGTPTVHCEALAMRLALQDGNVLPEQVSFVETHGTGTAVGDPLEVAAITRAYHSSNRKRPLVIGSVKTNVGHTESCSGITGIMKTVLAMQHQIIPKHLNMRTLNPEIFLDSIPATIPMKPVPWPIVKGQPRIAGVSSFGITGTDGHVILEEAPDFELPKMNFNLERPIHLLKVSGKSSEALEQLLQSYKNTFQERADMLDSMDGGTFGNAAFSANVGRATFNYRAFIVAKNYGDAAGILQRGEMLHKKVEQHEQRQICFLFTGQGAQYHGMAKSLYDTSPVFRVNFDICDRMCHEFYNMSIRNIIWDSNGSLEQLNATIYSQTAILCIQYCLLKLWESWGIRPDYVLGHSLGEFCAAIAAGVLEFEDALKLVASDRPQLLKQLPRGSLLVIKASKPEVEQLLKSAKIDLDFSALNSHEQTVVAGDPDKIKGFLVFLKEQGVKAATLEVPHAFHSRHIDHIVVKYRSIVETINFKTGNGHTKFISSLEGRIIEDLSELDADYWMRHIRNTVNFVGACTALRETGCQDFVEIGPQPVLSGLVMINNEGDSLNCFPSLRRGKDDWQTILTSLGRLYLLGYEIDWAAYDEPYKRRKVSLPFHPFNRKSFWVERVQDNIVDIAQPVAVTGYSKENVYNPPAFPNQFGFQTNVTSNNKSGETFKTGQFWEKIDNTVRKDEKIEILSVYLRSIIKSALCLELDETINDEEDLENFGVDSLMRIEVKNSIQSLLGPRINVTANLLRHCKTLRDIAMALVAKISNDKNDDDQTQQDSLSQQQLIQILATDAILEESIKLTSKVGPACDPSKVKSVLITGATGKLGPYILSQLVKSHRKVENIYCLIRGVTSKNVSEKLKETLSSLSMGHVVDMTKIECISGDVTSKNMGIPQDKYEHLCKNVDAVIHCAAKVHYSESYLESENGNVNDIRSVNVGGTLNILKFASTTKVKHVYYPSAFFCGIFEECENGSLSEQWPGSHTITTIVNLSLVGFKLTKFVNELLLKQANERGIPCKVFRFSWIAGENGTGRLSYHNNMYILRYLTFLKLKAIPSQVIPGIFLPVDMCAEHSLKLFLSDETPFGIFNIGHPEPQVELEFVNVAKKEFGVDLEIVEWGKYAKLLKDNDVSIESLRNLYNEQRQFGMYMGAMKEVIQGYRNSPETFFKNRKIAQYIPNYEESVPSSMEIITRDLKYLQRIGFFEKFGI